MTGFFTERGFGGERSWIREIRLPPRTQVYRPQVIEELKLELSLSQFVLSGELRGTSGRVR